MCLSNGRFLLLAGELVLDGLGASFLSVCLDLHLLGPAARLHGAGFALGFLYERFVVGLPVGVLRMKVLRRPLGPQAPPPPVPVGPALGLHRHNIGKLYTFPALALGTLEYLALLIPLGN